MQLNRAMGGAILLCLMLCATSCAQRSIVVKPVKCLHPVVDVRTQRGLVRGLMDYHAAVNACNTLNGYPAEYGHKEAKK